MLRYCLTIGFLFSATWLCAQEVPVHFFLLRTGYLVEGTATFDGKNHTVRTEFGSMNVPAQNVLFIGKSKKDVYLHKRSTVDPANANALIRLAEWCVSNGLIEEGIAAYQQAGQMAPNAAFAGLVRERLETLRQTESSPPFPETSTPPPVPQADAPTVSQIAFENFVRRVQPVLVNRCVSTDCHGTSGDHYFKMGIPQESMGSTSRRNLQAALQYVNPDSPMESPLLMGLVIPHGGAKTALSIESGHYIQTARWVQQVAKELSLEYVAEKASQGAFESSADTPIRVTALPEQFRQAVPKAERPMLHEPAKPGALDPLDPHVFNEKYHRESGQRELFR